ncbi:MAG: putative toxin-antitoxin system toxin component, PIN family [Succinivibrio sp.]
MIKVMLDTNIFISAALFPKGKVAQALIKAIQPPFQPYVCDYVIDDLHRKFYEKFPDKITALDAFLFNALEVIKRVRTPAKEESDEKKIRDTKDRPILRAATTVFFLTRVVAFFIPKNNFLSQS